MQTPTNTDGAYADRIPYAFAHGRLARLYTRMEQYDVKTDVVCPENTDLECPLFTDHCVPCAGITRRSLPRRFSFGAHLLQGPSRR